jgi:hypothetical protein
MDLLRNISGRDGKVSHGADGCYTSGIKNSVWQDAGYNIFVFRFLGIILCDSKSLDFTWLNYI